MSSRPESGRKRRRGSITGGVAALAIDTACTPSKSVENTADEYQTTPRHSRLLELPNEILLHISTQLCGTSAVFQWAVANKRLRSITIEAMAKHLIIPPNHIKKAIAMLTNRRELISKVNSIDFGAYMSTHKDDCLCTGDINFERKATKVLRAMIPTNTNGQITWSTLNPIENHHVPLWSPNHQYLMTIMLSLCPNVREITIQMPKVLGFCRPPPQMFFTTLSASLPSRNPEARPRTIFQGSTLALMQNKLRKLTIPPNDTWIGLPKQEVLMIEEDKEWRTHGKNILTFKGFHKLKHLDLDMDLLGLPASVVFQSADDPEISEVSARIAKEMLSGGMQVTTLKLPAKVLPLSLITLRLRSCTKDTFAVLQRINEIPIEKLNLKHITLFFDHCARTSILLCYRQDRGRLDYLRLLRQLSRKGINLTFFTGKYERRIDMHRELEPLYYISPCEAGLVTLAQKQFSELNVAAVMRHRKSAIERSLFAQHALTHFNLLNSATFDAKAWKNAAFFHGKKSTKYDPDLQEKKHPSIHINTNSHPRYGLDNWPFKFERSSGVGKEVRSPKAVVFEGKIFGLTVGSMWNVEVFVDEPVHKVPKKVADQGSGNLKVAMKVKAEGRRRRKRGTGEVERKKKRGIMFKVMEGLVPTVLEGGFDGGVLREVSWKAYLQPHVEPKAVV